MHGSRVLWIDLRYNKGDISSGYSITFASIVSVISGSSDIDATIQEHPPEILVFDYDFPDQVGLETLQNARIRHPEIPVVMLTRDHSADLAIWALRSRIRDYFIKPVADQHLMSRIVGLLEQNSANSGQIRNTLISAPAIPSRSRPYKIKTNSAPTAYATSYVQQHLDEKITLDHVARLCGMSKSHFSRTFRRDHRTTFQNFLIQQRIDKAVDLLQDSSLLITQIALAVGFSDLSSFTHTFQRRTGILPSCYRKTLQPRAQ